VDDTDFFKPGDMPEKIKRYCAERGQGCPETVGEIAAAVYRGLVEAYGRAIKGLEELTGNICSKLYIVGGGAQDKYLSKMIAERLGVEVSAGPIEAAAIGNAVVQMITIGLIKDMETAKRIIRDSFDVKIYGHN